MPSCPIDREELIGKWVTVKYLDIQRSGIPRFPVFKDVRQD